jgi:hypothetical protein
MFLKTGLLLTGSGLVGQSAFAIPRTASRVPAKVSEVEEVLEEYLDVWSHSSEPLRVWLITFYELVFRSNLGQHTTLAFFRHAARTITLPNKNTLTILTFLEHAFQEAVKRSKTTATFLALDKILHALQRTTHSVFTPRDYQAYKKYRENKLKWLAKTRAIDLAFREGKKSDTIRSLRSETERLFLLFTDDRDLYTQHQTRTRLKLLFALLIRGQIQFPAVELAVGDLVNKYPTKVYLERPYQHIINKFRA